jgi:hypothetical protein
MKVIKEPGQGSLLQNFSLMLILNRAQKYNALISVFLKANLGAFH